MKAWTILLLLATAGCASGPAAPDEGWRPLFAPDLSDAVCRPGVWSVANGELTATQDECIWTQMEYENFVLDLEFKNGPAANSGVIVYCSNPKNWVSNSVEIQILDDYDKKWAKVDKTWLCGGVFGHLAPSKQTVRPAGEWNRMTVTCRGQRIRVELNGELTADADLRLWASAKKNPDGSDIPPWQNKPKAELPPRGLIGLQGKHGGAPIWFRNVRIRPLSPSELGVEPPKQ